MPKYIKEVFNDYGINNNLIEAEIENINLYKKTNKLQIKIASVKEITLQDIESFENYLINAFKVSEESKPCSKDTSKCKEIFEEDYYLDV